MAGYRVSYKVLRQQGDEIKATAKLIDDYTERVGQIRGKLGSDGLLAEIRSNLQKLQSQLGESRAILNTAGEFLVKSVESYSGTETRQVKKVDGTKAHSRDFYKNPVVVAAVGTARGGIAAVASGVNAATVAAPMAATAPKASPTNSGVNIGVAAGIAGEAAELKTAIARVHELARDD